MTFSFFFWTLILKLVQFHFGCFSFFFFYLFYSLHVNNLPIFSLEISVQLLCFFFFPLFFSTFRCSTVLMLSMLLLASVINCCFFFSRFLIQSSSYFIDASTQSSVMVCFFRLHFLTQSLCMSSFAYRPVHRHQFSFPLVHMSNFLACRY